MFEPRRRQAVPLVTDLAVIAPPLATSAERAYVAACMGLTGRLLRRGLRKWERQLRQFDGYERLPSDEHLIAAELGISDVFGVGTECRVFISERALYLLSTLPRYKGVPPVGSDVMATRVPFDAVQAATLAPSTKRLFVAYDSPHGPEGRIIDFSQWGLFDSFVNALSEHVPLS
jgi:hypothetical protein